MKMLTKLTSAAIALGMLASSASAAMITGNITFSGASKLDSNNLAATILVENFTSVEVESADGSFAGLTGEMATFNAPWYFATGSTISSFWTVGDFSFDLHNSWVNTQDADFLSVKGMGTIKHANFDDTTGVWLFSSQGNSSDNVFSFSGSTRAIPDGGATAALLGLALLGLAGFSRRFKK